MRRACNVTEFKFANYFRNYFVFNNSDDVFWKLYYLCYYLLCLSAAVDITAIYFQLMQLATVGSNEQNKAINNETGLSFDVSLNSFTTSELF